MKPRVLIIANNGPDISFGGGQRNLLVIKLFEAKGFHVDLVLLINKNWGIYDENSTLMQSWKSEFGLIKFFQPSFKNPYLPNLKICKWFKKEQHKYDTILFRDEITAFKSGFYFLNNKKIIIDMNDFLYPHISGYRKIKYIPLYLLVRFRTKKVWVLINNQIKYFNGTGYCIPNLPLNNFYKNENVVFKKNRTVFPSAIFVSSYLGEFINFLHIGDEYLDQIKNLKIYIISRAITPEIRRKYNNDRYVWLNDVEDVTEYYSKAWISIIPGYKKDGPLIKVIESIYFETPVVCTEVSINGYECFNTAKQLIPMDNDVPQFISKMNILLNENLGLIGKELKTIAENKFSFNAVLAQDCY